MPQERQYKIHCHDIGYGPVEWKWPADDEKLFSIFNHVADIDKWVHLCDERSVVVQAGGAIGLFPLRLSHLFEVVYTFEARAENYDCLVSNCVAPNVKAYNLALSDTHRRVSVTCDPPHTHNYGAGYIVDDDAGVDTVRIDDFNLPACDLIFLDIEGAELEALRGAYRTIEKFHPLIVVEDKPMPQLEKFNRVVGDIGRWLQTEFMYEFVARHRWDSVYK